jgi:hypothetical protein
MTFSVVRGCDAWALRGWWSASTQSKVPFTVARRTIFLGLKFRQRDAGSFALRVGGVGRRNGRLHCWVHTPSKNLRPSSWIQSYIA